MRSKAIAWGLAGLVLALLLALILRPADTTSVGQILSNPNHFDQKTVVVTGLAESVRPRVSRRGNEYTTLKLADGTGQISVFSWGQLVINSGDRIEVKGIFHRVKRVGRYTFYNEIEASSVKRVR